MGKLALYRKYRPQTFDELYGQDHVAKTLKNSVKNGTFGHAYLFCGPRGTGKTSAARLLAKAANCIKNSDGNPDNSCQSCESINSEKAMDIIEIDAASHTQVDNIREIIVERANFAPTSLKYKVYIIDEAHMLSKSSFNALLKTLEEPPKHVIIILATTEASKIIPTIVSRCQRFDFKRIGLNDLTARLDFIAKNEKIDLEEGVTKMIAEASDGGFRDAISLLDQLSTTKNTKITKKDLEENLGITESLIVDDYIEALLSKEQERALNIIRDIVEEGHNPAIFHKTTIEHLRKILMLKVGGDREIDSASDNLTSVKKTAAKTNISTILEAIDALIVNDRLYKNSSIPELGLEISTIKICLEDVAKPNTEPPSKIDPHPTVNEPTQPATKTTATIEAVKSPAKDDKVKWQEFLLEIKNRNNSIHAFLKVCDPEFRADDIVALNFPYKFHKERIEDSKNRQIVEDSLEKVYGTKFKVKCILSAQKNAIIEEKKKNDDLLEEALEIFGGEVIE